MPAIAGLRWVPSEKLHITVAFLGDMELNRMDEIRNAIIGVASTSSNLTLKLNRLAPSPHRSPMVWAEFSGVEEYRRLIFPMRQALKSFAEMDQREPHIHVTLARPGRERIRRNEIPVKEFDGPDLMVDSVELWESESGGGAVVYRVLGKFVFGI